MIKSTLAIVTLVLILAGCGPASQENDKKAESIETEANEQTFPAPAMRAGRPESVPDEMLPLHEYILKEVHEVDGRQGIAFEKGIYYVSGSTTLSRYDSDWTLLDQTEKPFEGFDAEVNHIGDIDVYNGEIYAGVEYFMDGEAKNIQMAVYDAETFELKRTWPFAEESGQTEVSGIAVDPDHRCIWLCSWADGESGRYLYRYDLSTGAYQGRLHLFAPPQWIQGVAYHGGYLYITADDGTADDGEPDHIYRCKADPDGTSAFVMLERTLDDVTLPGEIEGLSFDHERERMLVSYNRGARIVLGMPRGLYEGYDKEIHEIFIYDMKSASHVDPQLTSDQDGEDETDDSGWLFLEKP